MKTLMAKEASLEDLAAEFFKEFARYEYCLKRVGFLKNKKNNRDAEADWGRFASEVTNVIDTPKSERLSAAIYYFTHHPPRKQIVRSGNLDWEDHLPDHESNCELVLRLICRVRNNLFHGGKFNGHWFEPQRSEELMRYGLVILRACARGHSKVRAAYAGQRF